MWTVEVPVSVQSWGRFGGAAARADRLLEIKELKIDRRSEEFKDCNIAGFIFLFFMRGRLKIAAHSSTQQAHNCK